jgi:predicted ArsR family transcriptional regulator
VVDDVTDETPVGAAEPRSAPARDDADRLPDARPAGLERAELPTRSAPLDLLKALGDNTRYAIYLELARSPIPLATADVAEILDLHVNTVRPHLERMRDVGLLQVETSARGGVGRPQHRYSLAPDSPSLGLEPSPFPTLARVLLAAASAAGLDREELADAGRDQGRADARQWPAGVDVLDALIVEQAKLGFDPAVIELETSATMAFAHCPFRDLAEAHPDLVCALHRGLVEGFVETVGGCEVTRFGTLLDREPCQVDLGGWR